MVSRSDINFFGVMITALILVFLSIGDIIPTEFVKYVSFWWVLLLPPYLIIKMTYIFSGYRLFAKSMEWFSKEIKIF